MRYLMRPTLLLAILLGACSTAPQISAVSPANIVLTRARSYTDLQQSFDVAKTHCDQHGREAVYANSTNEFGIMTDNFECRAR